MNKIELEGYVATYDLKSVIHEDGASKYVKGIRLHKNAKPWNMVYNDFGLDHPEMVKVKVTIEEIS